MQTDYLPSAATGGNRYRLADIPQTSSQIPKTTPGTRKLVDEADVLYRETANLHGSVHNNRRDLLILDLEDRTSERAKDAPRAALEQLSEYGFAWRDIARILGVSVPAVNKWRKGEGITGPNRLKIARLLALLDMLRNQFVQEPASWLEMPIRDGVALTPITLLANNRYDLVLELASADMGAGTKEEILNEYAPDWRTKLVDDTFETFVDNEGVVGIRPKGHAN